MTLPAPESPTCVVCRKPLHPGGANEAFGTAGQVMFGAHEGKCADTVRRVAGGAAEITHALLEARAPKLLEGLQFASEVFRRTVAQGGGGNHG